MLKTCELGLLKCRELDALAGCELDLWIDRKLDVESDIDAQVEDSEAKEGSLMTDWSRHLSPTHVSRL